MSLAPRLLLALTAAATTVVLAGSAASRPSAPLCLGKRATLPIGATTGTPRNDVLIGTPGEDRINAGAGNDIVCGLGGNDRVDLGSGNDRADGGSGNDVILGGPGTELRINGGAGNDTINVGSGNDLQIDGGAGADLVTLGPGNDIGSGGRGDDRLFGITGNDILRGGPNNDLLNGGPGQDRGFGDGGQDTCIEIEITVTCEVVGPTGPFVVEIKQTIHYHPPNAVSSFSCALVEGPDGAHYLVIATGVGVRNGSMQKEGTFGMQDVLVVFPIVAAGDITFEVRAEKDGRTATDMETYNVPRPGPPENQGNSRCSE